MLGASQVHALSAETTRPIIDVVRAWQNTGRGKSGIDGGFNCRGVGNRPPSFRAALEGVCDASPVS